MTSYPAFCDHILHQNELVAAGICHGDTWNLIFINNMLGEILKLSPGRMDDEPFLPRLTRCGFDEVEESLSEPHGGELIAHHKEGSMYIIRWKSVSIDDSADGEQVRLVTMSKIPVDQINRVAELPWQELTVLLDSIHDGIWVIDSDGITLRVNKAMERIAGLRAEEVIGKHVTEPMHKGTLLLDEIGELPLPMQAKLLQVLDGHPFHRVGGTKPITVDVRVIAATNKPLADMAASGQFREDLFYRLRVLTVEIPPLRERPDDIPVLAMHFLQEIIKKSGLQKNFDPQVLNCFLTYRWPGNVRELRALVQSLATMSEEETITMQDLPQYMQAQSPLPQGSVSFRQPMREAVAELERNMIMAALTETGSTYKAARRLKVSQSTIVRKAQRYKIGLVEIAHK